MRIEKNESVAVAIDYQERLVPAMEGTEELVEKASILLEGLRVLDVPVVMTQQYTKGLGETIEEIRKAVGHCEYVEKIRFSAFEEIKKYTKGKKFVIVCGIEAHICVLQTVIDIANAGLIPVLVTDCIASRKEKDYQNALERAKSEGAILTTYETLLFELLQVAGTDTSKQIQRLIK